MTSWRIEVGDCRDVLRAMPAGSVHTVVTSPPYFGLRDYGTGDWEGGDSACDHSPEARGGRFASPVSAKQASNTGSGTASSRDCPCGARRVDRQIGLEPTPDEFVAALVAVFRAVRRVLSDDGTVWLNLGDSYASSPPGIKTAERYKATGISAPPGLRNGVLAHETADKLDTSRLPGTKPKDLLGIPWMVAFALRADGWYLRSDIIWSKPNPMPESVTDRPTKSHEYVFLLSKGPRYFYDADAIREPINPNNTGEVAVVEKQGGTKFDEDGRPAGAVRRYDKIKGANKRSVWTVATQPYAGAHFATFPPKLIEPCILAGAPERACAVCGAPWVRVVETVGPSSRDVLREAGAAAYSNGQPQNPQGLDHAGPSSAHNRERRTLGFEPSCSHGDSSARGVVLDPFAGAGTTGLVALQHGREFVGIELSPKYAAMARDRIETAVRLGFRAPQNGAKVAEGQESLFLP